MAQNQYNLIQKVIHCNPTNIHYTNPSATPYMFTQLSQFKNELELARDVVYMMTNGVTSSYSFFLGLNLSHQESRERERSLRNIASS